MSSNSVSKSLDLLREYSGANRPKQLWIVSLFQVFSLPHANGKTCWEDIELSGKPTNLIGRSCKKSIFVYKLHSITLSSDHKPQTSSALSLELGSAWNIYLHLNVNQLTTTKSPYVLKNAFNFRPVRSNYMQKTSRRLKVMAPVLS